MYATKSNANNGADEKHQHLWAMYRPTTTINFSDIVEDGTIYDQTRTEMTFDSGEMSGHAWQNGHATNQPEIDPDAVSVDDILGNSIVHEIRHLSQSKHGALGTSIRDSFSYKPSTSQFLVGSNNFSCVSDDFKPGEELVEQLVKDEHSWEQEFAEIPQAKYKDLSMTTANTSRKPPPKQFGKLTSLTDFSVAYLADSISGNTDISIGRFFQNRCGDLREIIPENNQKKSKEHVPMALVQTSFKLGNGACETDSQHEQPQKDMDGMLTRMNSTKIEEQDNHWRQINHSSADTESVDELTMAQSNYSPIKNRSPLKGLHANYNDAVTVDRRCNSQMSTHSEFTQQDGKFPLKSNSSELIWECVKLRKSITKSFVIKNTSEKKLSLKIGVYGPGFQIASRTETDSLVLQGNECRTISVTFCPTTIGKAIGKVVFRPKKNWPEDTQRSIFLWAYGGSTVLQLQGVERGPVGCSFLKMAETSSITSTTLKRTFSIYNKGPLNGVATIFVKPKTDQYINENNIVIEPNKCVIRPDCSTTINVTYKLRRRDLERLRITNCEVLTIGTLEVIFGAEANRQRIASMLTRKGDIPSMYKQLQFLVDGFPVASLEHFKDFREHIDNVSDLFGCFKTTEIALTINRTNLDESRDNDLTMEDSVMFRSMIETPKPTATL